MMPKCKKCNDTGEYFSGYYSHPDTNGYDRYMPTMYKCECVKKEKQEPYCGAVDNILNGGC